MTVISTLSLEGGISHGSQMGTCIVMLSFLEQYSYVKFLGIAIVMLSFLQMQQKPTLSSVYWNRRY